MAKKNTTRNIIAALLIGGAAYLWFRNRASKVSIGTPSLPYQKLTSTGIELDIMLPIVNGSGFAITIQNFIGNIVDTQDGSQIGYVQLATPQKIPAYGRVELKFKSTISYTNLALETWQIIQSNGKIPPGKYGIDGVLVLPGGVRYAVKQPLF